MTASPNPNQDSATAGILKAATALGVLGGGAQGAPR